MAALPTIQELLGGHVIGTISALVLYGIFLAQTYVYAMNCGNDPLYLKLCVMCMAVLETLHSIFMSHMLYSYAIDDFGNPLGISHIIWSFGASVICQILIFVIVQSLYIRRIYILSDGNRVLTLTLLLTLFVLLVDAFTSAGLLFTYDLWAVFRVSRDFYSVVGGLALASLLDLVIAITLIYYLWRNKTGFRRTDSIVHVLMAYCVNSGLLTMIFSAVTIITFALLKESLLFVGFFQICIKLYANSLMGTLNARGFLRQMRTIGLPSTDIEMSAVLFKPQDPTAPRHIEIFRETSKIVSIQAHDGPETVFVQGKDDHGGYNESMKGCPVP